MTAFLRLNGIAVPIANGSAELSQEDLGASNRAVDGTPIFNRRGVKKSWGMRTTIRTVLEAMAWRELVTGRGHVISLDSTFYTSKGLAPSAVGASFTLVATLPKYGAKRAASAADTTNKATWPLFSSTSAWTICLWDTVDGGTTWTHYVVDSSARKWVDGVRNDGASTTFLAVAAGAATLGVTSVAHGFDDVVALPYLLPTDWPAQIHGFGFAFGLLPRLTADGLFIEQNTKTSVKGEVGGLKPYQGYMPTLTPDLHDFAFSLLEC